MKKIFTLAAAGALVTASFGAQAQVTVDGQLTATELTAGNYVLLGKSDNFTFSATQNQNDNRPFGSRGLLGLYVASTATKVYIFLGGTVDPGSNAFQLYMDVPGGTGIPAGTLLPAGTAGTSFEKITRIKLDQTAKLALALRGDGTPTAPAPQNYKVEAAAFTSTTTTSAQLTSATAAIVGDGTALALSSTATVAPYAGLDKARMAYRNTTDGKIGTNPGNAALYNTAAYAGVGSYGWEIELDRAALGAAAANSVFRIFAIYNNGNGGYASGEFIPKATAALPASLPSPNLGGADNGSTGNDVDFGAIAGTQSASFTLSATGVLGTKAADNAALALQVYPNPASSIATVEYNVGSRAENVNIMLTDLMGRNVQSLANGLQPAGKQSALVSKANVAAGTYLVRVQVGDKVSTRKVVLL